MASEWIQVALASACTSIDYGYTASASADPVGPRFLRITDIVGGHLDWDQVPYVAIDSVAAKKYRLHHGDIVLARTGASTGSSQYISHPPDAVFASYLVRLKIGGEFNARFVSYYLKSEQFWKHIRGVLGDKSAQPNASATTMTRAPMRVPRDLGEQRAIAAVLGALDDKIELNRRMNATLEGLARALFRSWFVDFDPVRAKMDRRHNVGAGLVPAQEGPAQEGNHKGLPLPPAIDALFPDEMVVGEDGGKRPRGWGGASFASTVEIIGGGTPKTTVAEYWDGPIPWFSVVDAPSESDVFVIDTVKHVTELGIRNSSTQVLPVGTVIISARGTVGKVALVGVPMAMNQSCYGLRGLLGLTGTYAYFSTRSLTTALKQNTHGSVFDTITRDTLESTSLVVPPRHLVSLFEERVDPLMMRIRANLFQDRTLTALRDGLLPKLMAGEVRVRPVEEGIANAL